jgi:hypothetical protein
MTFAQAETLRGHMAAIHQKAKPFACFFDGCDYATMRLAKLVEHQKTKHAKDWELEQAEGEILRPFLCKVRCCFDPSPMF